MGKKSGIGAARKACAGKSGKALSSCMSRQLKKPNRTTAKKKSASTGGKRLLRKAPKSK